MKRIPEKTIFSERLRGLRCERFLSMEKLSDEIREKYPEIRLNKSTISRYENGTQEPQMSTVAALASFFGVSPSYLIGDVDDRSIAAQNIQNSAVVQGNNATTLIVRNGSVHQRELASLASTCTGSRSSSISMAAARTRRTCERKKSARRRRGHAGVHLREILVPLSEGHEH